MAIGAGVVTTRSIIGVGGLAKTVVGFVTGIVGSQFIVARPIPRAFVFFTATVCHAIIFIGLYSVIEPMQGPAAYGVLFGEAAANALIGIVICQVAESLPGAVDRRRMHSGMHINRRIE